MKIEDALFPSLKAYTEEQIRSICDEGICLSEGQRMKNNKPREEVRSVLRINEEHRACEDATSYRYEAWSYWLITIDFKNSTFIIIVKIRWILMILSRDTWIASTFTSLSSNLYRILRPSTKQN